jgi:MFS family permease
MSLTPKKRVILSSFAAIYGIGYLSYMLMPLQIGALIEALNLNEAEVGAIATAELISLAITLFIIAPNISLLSRRKLALTGAVIVIIGHAMSASASSYEPLIIYRVITGIGTGMVLAAGNALIASSANPQRLFAIVFTIGQMAAACLLFILPEFIARWAHSGIYGFLAGWSIVMILFLVLLPEREDIAFDSSLPTGKLNFKIFLLPSVLAMILIGASDSSLWTFQERIAESLGLDNDTIGLVLGGALLSGMLGAGLAAIIGTRVGKVLPIVVGLVWMAVCYLLITHTASSTLYIAVELSYLFAYGFVIPYLFGLNAEIDPEGGAMVAANGCNLVGMSLGPVCAGYIIVNSSYPTVGISISFMVLIAMVMFIQVLRKL